MGTVRTILHDDNGKMVAAFRDQSGNLIIEPCISDIDALPLLNVPASLTAPQLVAKVIELTNAYNTLLTVLQARF